MLRLLLLLGLLLGTTAWAEPECAAKRAVVMVLTDGGGGSGFLTKGKSGKPIVITNYHVCRGGLRRGSALVVRVGEFEVFRKILGGGDHPDLCALEYVPGEPLKVAPDFTINEKVHVQGHPKLQPLTWMGGEVWGFTAFRSGDVLGDLTFKVFPGNSGSPVMDEKDAVVGVVDAMGLDGHGLFVPLSDLQKFLEKY